MLFNFAKNNLVWYRLPDSGHCLHVGPVLPWCNGSLLLPAYLFIFYLFIPIVDLGFDYIIKFYGYVYLLYDLSLWGHYFVQVTKSRPTMEIVAIIVYQTWLDFFQFTMEEVLWLDSA